MTAPQTKPIVYHLVALTVAVVMLAVGLGRFGIWQPSELRTADLARAVEDGAGAREAPARPPLQVALVRVGFRAIGPTEQGGRLPTALLAVLATLALALAVASASDARSGMMVGVAYATMPLVFMNARQMFGGGVTQSVVTLLLAAVVYVVWGRPPPGATGEGAGGGGAALWRYGRWALLGTFALGVMGAGWLLGVAPVFLGAGLAAVLRWRDEDRTRRYTGVALAAVGAVVAAVALRAAASPGEAYSALTGAGPDMRPPSTFPTYEVMIEHIGHGLFPWTGIVAFGLVRLLMPPPVKGVAVVGATGEVVDEDAAWRESGLRLAALLTAVIAYGLQSFHWQQFGPSAFVAAAPLAVAAGLALRDAEREAQPWRLVTAAVTFVSVIMFRDYMLFPKSSYAALGLADGGPAFPAGFTGGLRDWWRAQGGASGAIPAIFKSTAPGEVYFVLEILLFVVVAMAALFQGAGAVHRLRVASPFRWVAAEEQHNRAELAAEPPPENPRWAWTRRFTAVGVLANLRAWLLGGALAVMVVFGLVGLLNRGLTTPVRGAFLGIAALPIVIVLGVYVVLLWWEVFAWFGRPGGPIARGLGSRVALVPAAAFVIGLIATQLYVPALSEHLSPRGVWAVIRTVRRGGEPVARYGGNQNDRATRYYANFEVRDIASESEAVEWLTQRTPRHFMIVGSDVFPSLNRAYRRTFAPGARENVPVIDATNSNLYVAASTPGERGSRNPLDAVVMSRDSLTRAQGDHWHPHGRYEGGRFVQEPARFDDAIEYVGYNLDSGGMSYVPVGGSFKITYHFRALRDVLSSHQIFVHVDGQCPRINGDHEPAGGRYPLRYWLEGDFVHDEQRITIPGYCRAGTYAVYIGFYQGDDRMRVSGGDHDRENRVVAARIVVR